MSKIPVNLRIDSELLSQVRDKASRDGISLITFVEAALTDHLNTVFTGVNTVEADRETVKALVKALVETSVKTSVEASVKTSVKASVETSIEPLKIQVESIAKKLLNLIDQVEQLENKAIKTENHPETLDKPLKVANTARTGGKVKGITFETNPDGSLIIRSIRGVRSGTFKSLSDADLASIGVERRGDKFYPLCSQEGTIVV